MIRTFLLLMMEGQNQNYFVWESFLIRNNLKTLMVHLNPESSFPEELANLDIPLQIAEFQIAGE